MSDRSRSGKARKGSRPVTAREREAARRRQQDQEREAARRRRRGRWIGTSISLAALLLVAGLEILLHRPTAEERSLLEMAPKLAAQAGCGPVRTIRPFPDGHDRTHIGSSGIRVMPPLSAYPSHPPVSGPHYPVPLDAGVYASPPPLDRAIHSLEHAAVIIWYDPSVSSGPEVARIGRFFAQGNERNHVIVAPYDYPSQGPDGRLPVGVHMALAAWHHLQYCSSPDLSVAYGFAARYRMDLYRFWDYRGDAPERWFTPI